eukprot:tig00021719_g23147.t1
MYVYGIQRTRARAGASSLAALRPPVLVGRGHDIALRIPKPAAAAPAAAGRSLRAFWSSSERSAGRSSTSEHRRARHEPDGDDHGTASPTGDSSARRLFRLLLRAALAGGLAVVAGVGAYVAYREYKDEAAKQKGMLAMPEPWEIQALSLLPLRLAGRGFAALFGADLSEVAAPLESFATINEFYARPLRPGARPVAPEELVCPVDGQVMHFGRALNDEEIEQVKGLSYQRSALFGGGVADSIERLRAREAGDTLPWYSITIFLGPGDYHRVHAPADMQITKSRHFPGYLFPLHPFFSRYIPHIFAMNERLVVVGDWRYGGIALAAVGSLDVGHITATFDPTIRVKKLGDLLPEYPPPPFGGPAHERRYRPGVGAGRGEELVVFHMGSTVVLVFQAPHDFEFALAPGQRLRVGQALGRLPAAPGPRPGPRAPAP